MVGKVTNVLVQKWISRDLAETRQLKLEVSQYTVQGQELRWHRVQTTIWNLRCRVGGGPTRKVALLWLQNPLRVTREARGQRRSGVGTRGRSLCEMHPLSAFRFRLHSYLDVVDSGCRIFIFKFWGTELLCGCCPSHSKPEVVRELQIKLHSFLVPIELPGAAHQLLARRRDVPRALHERSASLTTGACHLTRRSCSSKL